MVTSTQYKHTEVPKVTEWFLQLFYTYSIVALLLFGVVVFLKLLDTSWLSVLVVFLKLFMVTKNNLFFLSYFVVPPFCNIGKAVIHIYMYKNIYSLNVVILRTEISHILS